MNFHLKHRARLPGRDKVMSTYKQINAATPTDTSDGALVIYLNRLRTTVDHAEIRELSDQIERIVERLVSGNRFGTIGRCLSTL